MKLSFLPKSLYYALRDSSLRKWQLAMCSRLYGLVNLWLYPLAKRFYAKALAEVSPEEQLFLLTRLELGTALTQLHYISYWHGYRNPAVILVLSARYRMIQKMAECICPEAKKVCFDSLFLRFAIFLCGYGTVDKMLYARLYAHLSADCPSALYVYERSSVVFRHFNLRKHPYTSGYVPVLDPYLESCREKVAPDFLRAYVDIRRCLDYRLDVYCDYIHLNAHRSSKVPLMQLRERAEQLKEAMGIQGQYAILNLNCKENYKDPLLNRRRIGEPGKYNCLIDWLITRGYSVVIQGRDEQPRFSPRKGLIDYPRSAFCSVESDFALYAGAAFAVLTKSGTENFGQVCNIPVLGVDYTELCSMAPSGKFRFYPKRIKKKGAFLSWEELLKSPYFFDIGPIAHDREIEYVGMSEEEIIEAAEEFLALVEDPTTDWMALSPLQAQFKVKLHPLHLDLFHIPGSPCHAYLTRAGERPSLS